MRCNTAVGCQLPCASLAHTQTHRHAHTQAEEGSGLPVAIWDTRELLEDAPYKLLPASEPPNWLRDSLRRVLGWKKPRNKHELLFGFSLMLLSCLPACC